MREPTRGELMVARFIVAALFSLALLIGLGAFSALGCSR